MSTATAPGTPASSASPRYWAATCGRETGLRDGGGDEFVVGMWNTQEGQPTKQVLERIAEDLREHPVVLPDGEEVRLSFSGGACRWKSGDDVRVLVSRADEVLYRAKA